MLLVPLNHAPLLEAMDQPLDRAPHDGDASLAIVPAARDDQHLRRGIASRVLNLLLSEPGFGPRNRFRRRRQRFAQIQCPRLAEACFVECLTKSRERSSAPARSPGHEPISVCRQPRRHRSAGVST
jgi:hypothetical protein